MSCIAPYDVFNYLLSIKVDFLHFDAGFGVILSSGIQDDTGHDQSSASSAGELGIRTQVSKNY